jgi:hypothetical protein
MKTKLLFFLAVGITALLTNLLLFQLRYVWYLSSEDFTFLMGGYAACILGIILLWLRFPSRVLVATIALLVFIFPPLLDSYKYVNLDSDFFIFVLCNLLLFIIATELRRRLVKREA